MRLHPSLLAAAFALVACRTTPPAQTRALRSPTPNSDAARLAALVASAGATSEEISSGDGRIVIVPAWGARVMGVLFGDDNVLWTPPRPLAAGEWNWGGARTWLAPEGHAKGFYFDETWSGETWKCPPAIDPGRYAPTDPRTPGARAFRSQLDVTSNDGTQYALAITREISAADDPLATDPSRAALQYVGFRILQRLQNRGTAVIDRELDLWNMVMAKPPATMVIPIATDGDGPKWRDSYFEPIPPGYLIDGGDHLALRIAGPPRYKIGVPAARCRGLTGSVARLPEANTWQLIVNRFPCEPRGRYVERPKDASQDNGDPVQGYSHKEDGAAAFYEIESHTPATRLVPGDEQVEPVEVFFYRGPPAAIRLAAGKLFGIDGNKLHIF